MMAVKTMKINPSSHSASTGNKKKEAVMSDIFELMEEGGHEQVIFSRHAGTGLKSIVAIHDTTMGPALGGCRMIPYASTEEALHDALRLSKGMTYKCSLADVDYGGGKAVIIGDPRVDKTPELFRALGRFIGGLGGRFFTGTDMGTVPEDFVHAARESPSFAGLPESHGGGGDTSVPTAYGVMQGFQATAQFLWGSKSLKGKKVAVQGAGKVGEKLISHLAEEGAEVVIADTDVNQVRKLKERYPNQVTTTDVESIHRQSCDIFAPCAIGGVINDQTILELDCLAIVGSANNQLAEDRHGEELYKRNILYAPDYLVNAGGLILVADELEGPCRERVMEKTRGIYDMLLKIFERSVTDGIPTSQAADLLVLERLNKVADLKRILLGV